MANIKFALVWGGWGAGCSDLAEVAEGHAAPGAQHCNTMALLHPKAAILLQLLFYAIWTYRYRHIRVERALPLPPRDAMCWGAEIQPVHLSVLCVRASGFPFAALAVVIWGARGGGGFLLLFCFLFSFFNRPP